MDVFSDSKKNQLQSGLTARDTCTGTLVNSLVYRLYTGSTRQRVSVISDLSPGQ